VAEVPKIGPFTLSIYPLTHSMLYKQTLKITEKGNQEGEEKREACSFLPF